jgi:hypothetical protein
VPAVIYALASETDRKGADRRSAPYPLVCRTGIGRLTGSRSPAFGKTPSSPIALMSQARPPGSARDHFRLRVETGPAFGPASAGGQTAKP